MLKHAILVVMLVVSGVSCQAQKKYRLPGSCETCELMYVGMPSAISSTDTSAGWSEPGVKLLVSGTVYRSDGKTPAQGVILYYWQTDHKGLYSPAPGMDKAAERHGHIRGWIKTGKDGRYSIYTIRPESYPNSNNPAHIHVLVREPDIENEYFIDELVFDDDRFVTPEFRRSQPGRGGDGIMKVITNGNMQEATHDIFLGLNIPGYPSRL